MPRKRHAIGAQVTLPFGGPPMVVVDAGDTSTPPSDGPRTVSVFWCLANGQPCKAELPDVCLVPLDDLRRRVEQPPPGLVLPKAPRN